MTKKPRRARMARCSPGEMSTPASEFTKCGRISNKLVVIGIVMRSPGRLANAWLRGLAAAQIDDQLGRRLNR